MELLKCWKHFLHVIKFCVFFLGMQQTKHLNNFMSLLQMLLMPKNKCIFYKKKSTFLLQIFILICSIKSYLSFKLPYQFSFTSWVYAWIFHPLLLLFCKNRDECFCGNSLTRRVIHDSEECTETCKGNSREGCGGPWRVAIYKNPSHKQSKYLEL